MVGEIICPNTTSPIANHAKRSVPFVFIFNACRLTRFHGLGWCNSFQRLKPRHLIDANRVRILLKVEIRCVQVSLTNGLNLGVEALVSFLWRSANTYGDEAGVLLEQDTARLG